ncbi:MAG TPA: rhodanese-like domain-containing protein [Acidimicrobiales bacterium]|nr:rhodanese-like domain-containing protein [Acidimicrobiales bacterium]
MDTGTVAKRLGEVQLVDVRLVNEWQAGHIDGALHIPEEELAERAAELDRNRIVVTVCRAGTRSDDAAELLRGEGFDAHSLDGGLLAWKWAGLPLTGPIVEPAPRADLSSPEMQALHDDLIDIALAVQARFGVETEPTHEQLLEFLRDRLISEGRTPEEADRFLADMDDESGDMDDESADMDEGSAEMGEG